MQEQRAFAPVGKGATSNAEQKNRIVSALTAIGQNPNAVGLPTAGMLGPVIRAVQGIDAERAWVGSRHSAQEIVDKAHELAREAGISLPSGLRSFAADETKRVTHGDPFQFAISGAPGASGPEEKELKQQLLRLSEDRRRMEKEQEAALKKLVDLIGSQRAGAWARSHVR